LKNQLDTNFSLVNPNAPGLLTQCCSWALLGALCTTTEKNGLSPFTVMECVFCTVYVRCSAV